MDTEREELDGEDELWQAMNEDDEELARKKDEACRRYLELFPKEESGKSPLQQAVEFEMMDFCSNVTDSLSGLSMSNQGVVLLAGQRAVLRSDHKNMDEKVKILSGGKACFGNLFVGSVAPGMLTGAVIGDKHSVPSPDSILQVLRQLSCDHKPGILMIILNYLEDRVNFGLAMIRARSEGVKVDMIVVCDDAWERVRSSTGRKGLAGIILLFKVAGAMSEAKRTMSDIFATCRTISHMALATITACFGREVLIGVSLDREGPTLSVPIYTPIEDIVSQMMYYLLDQRAYFSLRIETDSSLILLFNSYNNDHLLLNTVVKHTVDFVKRRGFNLSKVYTGNFISGSTGFSITVLRDYGVDILDWLEKPTKARWWPVSSGPGFSVSENPLPSFPIIKKPQGPRLRPAQVATVTISMKLGIRAVIDAKKYLNLMDVDGVYGTQMTNGLKALWEAKRENELLIEQPYNFFSNVSTILEKNIPGLTGSIYGCFFAAIAQEFIKYSSLSKITSSVWISAFKNGVSAIQAYTKIEPGDGSLLDALLPASEALKNQLDDEGKLQNFEEAVLAAERGSHRTREMRSRRRKSYMDEVGSHCAALWMGGVLDGFKTMLDDLKREAAEEEASSKEKKS